MITDVLYGFYIFNLLIGVYKLDIIMILCVYMLIYNILGIH